VAAIDIFFVSTSSRRIIELERFLTMLEPTNTIVTLTEVWAAKSLSKEAILVTDSVGVAGVPLGGGGGGSSIVRNLSSSIIRRELVDTKKISIAATQQQLQRSQAPRQ
jgi:hypothetical protein